MFYVLHTAGSAQVPWSVAHAEAAQPFSNSCYLNVALFVPLLSAIVWGLWWLHLYRVINKTGDHFFLNNSVATVHIAFVYVGIVRNLYMIQSIERCV